MPRSVAAAWLCTVVLAGLLGCAGTTPPDRSPAEAAAQADECSHEGAPCGADGMLSCCDGLVCRSTPGGDKTFRNCGS